jgi:hypothetical protein
MAIYHDTEDSRGPKILRHQTSFPPTEKKQVGTNFIGKLFGKQPEHKSREQDSMVQEIGDIDRMAYLGNLKPAVFVRPKDPSHKGSLMQPRREEGFPPRGALSEDGSDSFISPITRARNRAEANAILTGRVSDEDLEFASEDNFDDSFEHAEQESFDDNFEYAGHGVFDNNFEHHEGQNVVHASFYPNPACASTFDITPKQQIEYVAAINGHGSLGVEQWKNYLECYTKVR